MQPATQDEHLEKLELKIMDLENTVQQLHEVLLKQYQDMDALKTQVTQLGNRIATSNRESNEIAPQDERPPHY